MPPTDRNPHSCTADQRSAAAAASHLNYAAKNKITATEELCSRDKPGKLQLCFNTILGVHHVYLADQTYLLQAQHSKGRNKSSNHSVKKRRVWLRCGADEVLGDRHISKEAAVEECLSHLHGHISPGSSQLKFQPGFKRDLKVEGRKQWQWKNSKAVQKNRIWEWQG